MTQTYTEEATEAARVLAEKTGVERHDVAVTAHDVAQPGDGLGSSCHESTPAVVSAGAASSSRSVWV